MTTLKVWRAIAEALEAEGVEYVFGLPGNVRHLLLDIFAHTKIKFVLVREENSAVACALAYARVTGRPGVVMSNPGPGITNIVTGLLEATSASVPVIAIANGVVVRDDGKGAFQELDAIALAKPVTKWAVRLLEPDMAQWTVRRAFSQSQLGRPGAVFIEVPSDLGEKEGSFEAYRPTGTAPRTRPAAEDIAAAQQLLKSAKRPVLVAGSGAVSSRAADALLNLAKRIGAPIFTTPGGRGAIAEDSPYSLGQVGIYFTRWGKSYWDDADLIISVGSRLEAFSTHNWTYYPKAAKLIQIDINPETIGLNWLPDVALVGDARLTIEDISRSGEELPVGSEVSRRSAEIARLHDQAVAEAAEVAADRSEPTRVPLVLAAINKVFGKDTVLCKENGAADLWCYYWPYYRVLDTYDCVPMGEQTAMGMGIIGTMGAKLANPDKQVVSIGGDGAMGMAMMEMATAAENKLGVTWVVLNNGAFGWVQYTQYLMKAPYTGTDFDVKADFAKIAEAQGCLGINVDSPAGVEDALIAAREANKKGIPALINVSIRAHDYTEYFVETQKLPFAH